MTRYSCDWQFVDYKFWFFSNDDRLVTVIGFVGQDDDKIMTKIESVLAQTPQEIFLEFGYNDEEIDQMFNAQMFDTCMMEYDFFQMFDFFGSLAASSNTWRDVNNWPNVRGGQMFNLSRKIGFFLLDFLHNPVILSNSPDMTVFDLLHAFNDAIEAAGDFGSVKNIIRSTLVLIKHASMFVEDPDKSCPLSNELFQIVKEGALGGPESLIKTLKGNLVKNAFLSFFEVRCSIFYQNSNLIILVGCCFWHR